MSTKKSRRQSKNTFALRRMNIVILLRSGFIIKQKTKKENKIIYDSTVTLLVYYEDFATSFDIKETKNSINNIINNLKNNNYVFKNVYLLLNINNKKQLITIK